VASVNAEGWCSCGLAANDPNHGAWHKLLDWNARLFDTAQYERMRQFEKDLADHDRMHGRGEQDPQTTMDVGEGQLSRHRANA